MDARQSSSEGAVDRIVAIPRQLLRRAVVMRQENEAEWLVVVRTFSAPPHCHPRLVATAEQMRTYAQALVAARLLADRFGYPVLIEPTHEYARYLSDNELRAYRNSNTAQRPRLSDILDRGPRYDR